MSSKSSSGSKNNSSPLLAAVSRTNSVASTSLHRTIHQHVNTDEYDAKTEGLDFLQVKNGLMISYLIDLTMILRSRCRRRKQQERTQDCTTVSNQNNNYSKIGNIYKRSGSA